ALLRQTIKLVELGRLAEARSMLLSNRGEALMSQIRVLITQMQTQENQLLQGRIETERQRLNAIVSLTIPGCLAIGLVLGILVLQLQRNLGRREEAERALRKQNEKLTLLYDTTRDLLSADDPITLLDALFQKLSTQLGVDLYLNYLVTPRHDQFYLRLASAQGLTAQQTAEFAELEFGQAVCGGTAQTAVQVCLSNVQNSTSEKTQLIKGMGVTAYASQPLINQAKVLGVLSFGSRSRTSFTAEEQELMQATADQVAIALDRSNLLKSLQQRSEELAKSNQIKDEFLAVLSHELRTPMNPILGWVQLLRQRKFDPSHTERALEIIERNAAIQLNLIDDLLDVSRILKGKLELRNERVDLNKPIQAAIDTVQLSAAQKGIALEFSSDQPCIVLGDANRLQQVVWNLLSNAIKFASKNGRVEVKLSRIEQESSAPLAEITVSDDGVGIDSEFLPHVFDRFRQADGSSTRQFGGLGLGLAIVRHLVELQGGKVEAASQGKGKGATFVVKLPVLEFAQLE
ncbi:MAG TPA: ATP-binding protein, partial [Leptolyngbya sp.]|nr:ATP-binding protein [Leptolyngbya sp.]